MEERELPTRWELSTIQEIAETIFGQSPPSSSYNKKGDGLPFFQGKGEFGQKHPTVEKWCTEPTREAEAGDILISIRAPVGPTNVADRHCVIGRGLAAIRPFIEPDFVRFWLWRSEQINAEKGTGTTFSAISKAVLNNHGIPVPPLNEQHRIVEKIETLFARLDKGEEGLRVVQKLLGRYRQSVLKAAVTGQLTADWRAENSAPEWREVELGNVTDYLTSGSRGWAKYYAESGALFIRAQNLKNDRLELDDVAFVDLPKKSEGTRTLVQRGDLLITITGANVTKTALVAIDVQEAYVSQHVGLLRLTDSADPKFIYWFLIAKAGGRKQLEAFAYGAGKPGLNLTNIREVRLALPSIREQWEIVARVQDELDRIEIIEEFCKSELTRSAALRQSILKDAFAGRLVPQDPNDEPASELLARIQAEREAGSAKRTCKRASS